jgi:hypothetical protein
MSDEETALDQEEQGASESPDEEVSDERRLMAELKEAITVRREPMGGLRLKLTVSVPRETVDQRLGKR